MANENGENDSDKIAVRNRAKVEETEEMRLTKWLGKLIFKKTWTYLWHFAIIFSQLCHCYRVKDVN